jgi:hypothetical protein
MITEFYLFSDKIFFMKKTLLLFVMVCCLWQVRAAMQVYMFPTPVTVVAGSFSTTRYYDIDVDNNGIDDIRIDVTKTGLGDFYVSFESLNNQKIDAEYINSNHAIAYNCSASYGAGIGWTSSAIMAKSVSPAQFDGKGPRYMAMRKEVVPPPFQSFVYGWLKLECPQEADEFTLYGYGYDDTPSFNPSVRAGQGECFNAPTGIYEKLNDHILYVADNKINFTTSSNLTLRLFDVAGRMLSQYRTEIGLNRIDLPEFSGMLFLEISDGMRARTIKIPATLY